MSTIDETWTELLKGGSLPSNPHLAKLVFLRIRNTASHSDEGARLDALRVAHGIGTADALDAARAYSRDPSLDVRRRLLALAREAGPNGLGVLRQIATDPDPQLATGALRQLILLEDRAATTKVRGLLSARHGMVRSRAAIFLGLFGGPSIVPTLRRAAEDEDDDTRNAVAWAIARLEGRTDAPPPEPGDKPFSASTARIESQAAQTRAAIPEVPAAPEAAGETGSEGTPGAPPAPPQNPSPVGDAQSGTAPADAEASAPDADPAAVNAIADTGGLPADASVEDVFRALASRPDRRDALVARLKETPDGDLSKAFRSRKAGQDAAANAGAALAAAALGNGRWLAPVRGLAGDPEPRVRAAVATALGALATPGVYRKLEGLAVDTDPTVQASAVVALAEGARRVGYEVQARRLIEALPETKDEPLVKARASALQTLEGEA